MAGEKNWLWIDRDFCESPRAKEVEALPDGPRYIVFLLMLLVKTSRKPFVAGRDDIVPCDKTIIAKKTGCRPEFAKEALNAFHRVGLVKHLTEKQLKEVVHGAVSANPPTPEEIEAYIREAGLAVDARRFYEYYAASKFRYKGQLMDWKTKLAEWAASERPQKQKAGTAAAYKPITPAEITMDMLDSIYDRI